MNDTGVDRLKLTESPAGIQFNVHVQPRASRNEVCGIKGDELRLRLTSPPVDDAANKSCIEFLARLLGVAKSRVSITAGVKSRHKTIRVTGVDGNTVRTLLK